MKTKRMDQLKQLTNSEQQQMTMMGRPLDWTMMKKPVDLTIMERPVDSMILGELMKTRALEQQAVLELVVWALMIWQLKKTTMKHQRQKGK